MALAGMLSAMREIILDLREIPNEPSARRALYQRRFPALSSAEIEDLAAIPHTGWRTYTNSIFAGERNLLARYFEVSLALLKQRWESFAPTPFDAFEFTRAVHDARPWRGRTSASLAQCFLDYLTIDRRDIIGAYPEIGEMARLEIIAPELRHAPNDRFSIHDSPTLSRITAMTVGELLTFEYYLPTALRFRTFQIDAPEIRREYYRSGALPKAIPRQETHAIASRNGDGFVRWISVEEPLYRYLDTQPRAERLPLETLATAYVGSWRSDSSEELMFQGFLSFIERCLDSGALVILSRE